MLEGLDRIDWAGLSHPAFGSAGAVPGHLRGLQSPDHATRETSFEELHHYLVGYYDQVAEAARPAIPFLVEIAAEAAHGRGYAALLLCAVARAARVTSDGGVRQTLEEHRDAIRLWSGRRVIDSRAFLLSCLDRFDAPEDRAERKVLRKLKEAVGELEAECI